MGSISCARVRRGIERPSNSRRQGPRNVLLHASRRRAPNRSPMPAAAAAPRRSARSRGASTASSRGAASSRAWAHLSPPSALRPARRRKARRRPVRSFSRISFCSTASRARSRAGFASSSRAGGSRRWRRGISRRPTAPRVIDCGGRTLMPGLIDAHWHAIFAGLPISALLTADVGFIMLAAGAEAERTLMRGFTTVRDLGGPAFGLKQAIDDGLATGPRIYPSGAMITSSGGHGDLRPLSDLPREAGGAPSALEKTGAASIADGADQVRLRAREQLLQGRFPGQAHRQRRGVVAAHDARHGDVQRARTARGGRDRGRPADLRRRARLSVGRDRAGDRGGRAMHRARPSHGRGDRPAHGGKGRVAQHPAVPQRGGHRPAHRPEPRERASGVRRDGPRLCARQGAQDQDRVRLGYVVLPKPRRAAGRHADPPHAAGTTTPTSSKWRPA